VNTPLLRALLLVVLLPIPARAASGPAYVRPCRGLDELGRRTGELPFPIGEELGYRLTFAGAYVGRFETKVGAPRSIEGRTAVPIFGRARTNSLVASFQPFVGRYMTMVDPTSFATLGLKTEITYGDDPRWEEVDFSADRKRIQASFRKNGHDARRTYVTDHPATDILALMFWARLLDLESGETACQDVFSSRRLWQMTGEVKGTSTVRTPVGKKRVRQVDLHFLRKPTPGLSRTHPPRYSFSVYVSTDEYQTPLLFRFMLNGMKAEGHLERWTLDGSKSDWAWERR
jgi:hypothetical protein